VFTAEGYHSDLNETFMVGKVEPVAAKLVKATHDCLAAAVAMCRPGVFYREVGTVITKVAKAAGFSVVTTFCGHGVGKLFHGPPNIPHYANNKAVGVMKAG
jgi:methionyl aminopeptidase